MNNKDNDSVNDFLPELNDNSVLILVIYAVVCPVYYFRR